MFCLIAVIQECYSRKLLEILIRLFGCHLVVLCELADDKNNIGRFEVHNSALSQNLAQR